MDLAIESRLHRKVVYLENVDASGEAQSSAARAARAARRVQQGLSGKQCKKKVKSGISLRLAFDVKMAEHFPRRNSGLCKGIDLCGWLASFTRVLP